MTFPIKKFTNHNFADYVDTYDFGPTVPNQIIVHQYAGLSPKFFKGELSIQQILQKYEDQNWPAFPHLFLHEDEVYVTYPMAKVGCHSGKHTATWIAGEDVLQGYFYEGALLQSYSLGIVLVGNYDAEKPSKVLLETLNNVIESLQDRLHLPDSAVKPYRDLAPTNSPGKNIKWG